MFSGIRTPGDGAIVRRTVVGIRSGDTVPANQTFRLFGRRMIGAAGGIWLHINVLRLLERLTFGFSANRAGFRCIVCSVKPRMAKRFALGLAANITGFCGGAGSVKPRVAEWLALGFPADAASFCGNAGRFVPLMTEQLSLGQTAGFTGFDFRTIGLKPSVVKRLACGLTTQRAGQRRCAGGIYPFVLARLQKRKPQDQSRCNQKCDNTAANQNVFLLQQCSLLLFHARWR